MQNGRGDSLLINRNLIPLKLSLALLLRLNSRYPAHEKCSLRAGPRRGVHVKHDAFVLVLGQIAQHPVPLDGAGGVQVASPLGIKEPVDRNGVGHLAIKSGKFHSLRIPIVAR